MRPSHFLGLLLLLPAMAFGAQVSGVVRDLAGQPLGGAKLEVLRDGKRVARRQASANGEYSFELPAGRYVILVRDPSLCGDGQWPLEVRQKEALTSNITFPRCVRITGRAFGPDGTPLARGKVTLRWSRPRWPEQVATTDAEGRFEFPRAAQDSIEVSLHDAAGLDLTPMIRWSTPQVLEIRADPALQVVVRGPEGDPLEGAFVVLVPEPLRQANLERQTDPQGKASLPATPGRYRLLAFWQVKDQFERYVWQDMEVASGTAAPRLELRFPPLPSGTLSGQVLSADGLPAGGAKVEARQRFSSLPLDGDFLRNTAYPRESAVTQADAEGRFTLRNLREGEYVLSLEHERGYGEAVMSTGAPSAAVKLWSSRCARTASGRVIDERGAPVRDFEIGPDRFKDPRGRFTIEGACVVLIRAKGFLPRYVPLPRPVPERVELGDIVVERGRLLTGRVVRSDGKSAVGLPLEVDSMETRSDKSGRFTGGPVPVNEGTWVVLEENGTIFRQRVRPGKQGEVTLRVPPGSSRLDVHVLGVEGRPAARASVTAEGEWGSISMSTDSSGHALLSVPPGPHEVRVTEETQRPSERTQVVPLRFPTMRVQVPEEGTLPLEISPARGAGRLRVLLPRPTHYDDVSVVPGAQPWPMDRDAWVRIRELALDADARADIWAQPGMSVIYYEVLNDFSELVPGPYTVFTTNSYGDEEGMPLFRQIVEVSGSGRQVVQVRFEGENTRVLRGGTLESP